MTSTRFLSAFVFAVVFIASLRTPSLNWVVVAIALFGAIMGAYEYCHLRRTARNEPVLWLAALIGIAFTLDGALCEMRHALPILAGALILSGAAVVRRNRIQGAAPDIAMTLFGGLYGGLPIGIILALRARASVSSHEEGDFLLLFIIATTWIADAGAYFVGRNIGRRPLCPKLSPKKTVEGLLGGVAFTFILALLMWLLPFPGRYFLSLCDVLAIAAAVAVVGPLGDLTESIIKRDAEAKDSGLDFTGHGGVLDIIDSLLFTAPAVFLYLYATRPELFL